MFRPLLALFGLIFLAGCSSFQARERRVFEVNRAWVRQTTEKDNLAFRKINRMTPLIVGDLVLQGNGLDGITAFERESGQLKWRLNIPNGAEPSATAIRDRVFVGASDGNFYSIDAKTGAVQWTFATKSENLGEPLLEDGIVYFVAGNNVLYALDAATGRQVWLYSRQNTSQFSIRGDSTPSLKNGTLFVGFSDGSLLAFEAKAGNVQWEIQLNRNKRFKDIDASPILDGDHLYVAGYDDRLYCVSASKGEIVWRIDGGGYSAVTILGDKIFYPTSTGEVWALSKASGEKLWTYKLPRGIATQVKVYKGLLVFGESQGRLQFLDAASGKVLGGMEPGRGILSSPLVDEKNSRVYFVSGEANLYAIDAAWRLPTVFQ